jgi:hypothetical protein
MNDCSYWNCLEAEFMYLVSVLIFYTVSETGSKESLNGITAHTDM